MKKILTITTIIAGSLLISACSSTKETGIKKEFKIKECQIDGKEAPKWVCGQYVNDEYIRGVGSAPLRPGLTNLTRQEAMNNARVDLSQTIETKIKNKVESFVRSTGYGKNESVDKVITNVSKSITKLTLRNSTQESMWQGNTEMFILVRVPKESVKNAEKGAIEGIKSSFKNDNALWQEFKAKQAQKDLDNE